MTDLATWTCALCGFTTDQPTTVDKVWHKCRQKRWRLHAHPPGRFRGGRMTMPTSLRSPSESSTLAAVTDRRSLFNQLCNRRIASVGNCGPDPRTVSGSLP